VNPSAEKSGASIAVIVLAAGRSGRLGRPKQLLQLAGESLLRHAARVAVESGVGPVFVVLPKDEAALTRELADLPITALENDQPEQGMSRSIRLGVAAAMAQSPSGIVLTTCDQIAVTSDHLKSLAAHLNQYDASAVASGYAGTAGVPAAFSAALFERLQSLAGDSGAKLLLQQLGARLKVIPLADGECDIDTFADLKNLL
jgi:molybdenum cofactor cytidylyltransferase